MIFFSITSFLSQNHDNILKYINESLKESGEDEISSLKLKIVTGTTAYLTLYFWFYPYQNILSMNNLFIDLSIQYGLNF